MNTIASDLSEQFDRAWDMLRATIGRITDEQWLAGDAPGLVPARWALHAIETVDFDMSRSPEEYTRRLDADEDGPVASLPSRSELLAYLDEVRASSTATLAAVSDADLLEAPNAFPWTGKTVLGRMLYTLRHTMTHQAELSMILRLHGAEETEWR